MLLTTLAIFLSSCAHAAISVPDQAQIGRYEYIPANAGAEQSTAKWTASGGAFTTTTSAGTVANGSASFSWDSNAASQTLTSSAVAVPSGWVGVFLIMSFDAKCSSGTCTHTFSADDGSTDYSITPTVISSTTKFIRQRVRFSVGSAGNIRLKVTSVNANEPAIYLDNFRLEREADNPSIAGPYKWVKINTACSSIIDQSEGSVFSSPSSGGTGVCTLTMDGWRSAPACVCTTGPTLSSDAGACNLTVLSSTSVQIQAINSNTGSRANNDVNLICIGKGSDL